MIKTNSNVKEKRCRVTTKKRVKRKKAMGSVSNL